jgi:formylglycine-generating enzyme required for sulfatase activity
MWPRPAPGKGTSRADGRGAILAPVSARTLLFLPAALACALLAGDLGAEPERHPAPPPAPPANSGSTSDGVVTLRTPGPDQVLIRAGTFTMGSTDAEFAEALALCKLEPARDFCKEEWFAWEQAPHEVYLSDFWIDRTEVTVARYRACVNAGACDEPPYATGGERFDRPDYPVSLVTWFDARRFCGWAGGRLPTEAEWERAARGPSGRIYPWGNVYNPFLSNHGRFTTPFADVKDLDPRDRFLELAPVGSYPDGRTPDGIDDLAGNVKEWVSDWFAPEYPRASAVNPKGPDMGDRRVARGGGYANARPWLRGASREPESPSERMTWIGFRCARDAK